ncbi:MAG TPA: 30S ribosomal protein S19 [Candidatus Nanoarchaeia archaeon]|nr:30S ribosomal protein S19 [Candidatus Nanoarchaeia archaeon]
MARKEFSYRGKSVSELKSLSLNEYAQIAPARIRRSIKRGFTEQQKILLANIRAKKSNIETHCKDMIILPEMIGMMIKIHNGKEFLPVTIGNEMIGHYLGEFVSTRKRVEHSAPGIGATKSSAALSVK